MARTILKFGEELSHILEFVESFHFSKIYKPEYFIYAAQKMNFSIKDFLSKCDQIAGFGHILWKIPSWKITFLFSEYLKTFCRESNLFLQKLLTQKS